MPANSGRSNFGLPLQPGVERLLQKVQPKGATTSARSTAWFRSAKFNDQESHTWLHHVWERLQHVSSVEDYEAFLP